MAERLTLNITERRDAIAQTIGPNDGGNVLGHSKRQSHPVLQRSAVVICPLVADALEKLIEEVTEQWVSRLLLLKCMSPSGLICHTIHLPVGTVNLNHVEAGHFNGKPGSVTILLYGLVNLRECHRPWENGLL